MGKGADTMFVADLIREITQPTRGRARVSVYALAAKLRVSISLLYQWADTTNKRRFPAELIAPLKEATGDSLLIEHICQECGGVFVPLPNGTRSIEVVSRTVDKFSGLLRSVSGATDPDGDCGSNVSHREAGRIREAGWATVQEVLSLVTEYEAQANEGDCPDGRFVKLAETAGAGQ